MSMKVWIGLGSNLGDRWGTLSAALKELEALSIGAVYSSSIYETPAWGGVAVEPFLNQVIGFTLDHSALTPFAQSRFKILEAGWSEQERTLWYSRSRFALKLEKSSMPPVELIAEALMVCLLLIELILGRDRSADVARWSSRTLDLDLLTISGDTLGLIPYQSDTLSLPHPRLLERSFVLTPWAEIAPSLYLSSLDTTVGELHHRLTAENLHIGSSLLPLSATSISHINKPSQ